jgi:3-phenylpropionate/trans-cinnamate dioxygenase ferredoxin component
MDADPFERVARLDDLVDGVPLGVETSRGERVCLLRVGDDVLAVSDTCTHQAFPMSSGDVLPDGTIQCAWHGARFDCRTGAVREGPADEPLPTYEVRVRGDEVFVGPRRP